MSDRFRLAANSTHMPYKQGDFDNLCGLYAALNAIRFVADPIRPINRAVEKQVFEAGLNYLAKRSVLMEALREGMSARRQHAVTRHMASTATQVSGVSLSVQRLVPPKAKPTRDELFKKMGKRLDAGSVLIVELQKAHFHYTVVARMSRTRLILFDSSGLRWIARNSVGVSPISQDFRHHVPSASVLEIKVARL